MNFVQIFLLVLLLALSDKIFSQDSLKQIRDYKLKHWGIKAGLNTANIRIKEGNSSASPASINAPTAGLFLELSVITGNFKFQPEILYSGMGFETSTSKVKMHYLSFPILVKKTFSNTGFGVYTGPQIGVLLAARARIGNDNQDVTTQFNRIDFLGVFGIEYQFPIGLDISTRYQAGFANIAKGLAADESIRNNIVNLTLGFRIK